ncbi:MAG: hypothetical protein AAB466_14820 [Verrucomicrobiota bacterium]
MSTVAEIKAAIQRLTARERCELNAWLQNWPHDDWDRQMRADAEAGKLDWMLHEARRAEQEGVCGDFPAPPA